MRLKITRLAFIWAASSMIAFGVLPAAEPTDAPVTPLLAILGVGDNEIPNPVLDGILEVGGEVVSFLIRMVPIPI
ncbi:MAG TPA: hypothetical protein VH678_21225 [Xanthobacteraceae bacterium]|jgi:hypothetical protein